MSTELETAASSNHEPTAAVATEPVRLVVPGPERSNTWWLRPGYQLVAGVVILVLVAAIVANNMISRQYSPDGTVRAYLGAVESGDSNAVWNNAEVAAAGQSTTASLIDQAAMRAALSNGYRDLKSFAIDSVSDVNAATAAVAVTVGTSSGSKQLRVVVVRSSDRRYGLYPIWRVELAPVILQFKLPAVASQVSIDARSLSLPTGDSTVAVLPLEHRLTWAGSDLIAPQTVKVDAMVSRDQAVPYVPTLTASGLSKAKAAVTAYLVGDVCVRRTTTEQSSSCPQSTNAYVTYTGQWSLVGDPTNDLAISSDGQNLTAIGHYEMVFSYAENGWQGLRHVAQGGGYSAQLDVKASDVSVLKITRFDGLVGLQRPAAATDQAAKDVVTKAFAQCAAVPAEHVADCPQQAPDVIITNVHWALTSDPVSGAVVTYDGNTGVFTMHGNFSMSVTYTHFGQKQSGNSLYTSYDAYLFWTGQAFQLVTIEAAS